MTPKQLQTLRAQRGWTQVELAERLGVGANTVAHWEQGVHAIPKIVENFCRLMEGKTTR